MTQPAKPATPKSGKATRRTGDGGFRLFLAVALAAAVFLVAAIRTRAPEVDPSSDAWNVADTAIRATLAPDEPHPLGTPAHDERRDRIVARFRELSYSPDVEVRWVASPSHRSVARVQNIVAGLPGREPGPTVHLVAHYDSVAAGPGASDDGLGVTAVLEIARKIREDGPHRRGVTFLLTDGEEGGLLGAYAYVAQHGTSGIAAVVNLEARGTTGPVLMFETGPSSAWTVAAWRAAAVRPITGSLFPAVYETLPNRTDLSVFAGAGVPGLNFACIGGVQRYHTPLDSREHVDVATYLHMEANALAAVRALADAPPRPEEDAESVWCDVLGATVVEFPESSTTWLSLVALLAIAGAAALRVRRLEARVVETLGGVVAALLALLVGAAAVWGVGALLTRNGALPRQFVAETQGAVAAAAGAALVATSGIALVARRLVGAAALHAGTWLVFACGAVVLAWTAPGASYLVLLPALVVAAASLVGVLLRGVGLAIESAAGLAAGAALWAPLVPLLTDGMGVGPIPRAGLALVAVGVPFVATGAALAPFVAAARRGWVVPAVAAVLGVAGYVVQSRAPAATPELPRPLCVIHDEVEGAKDAHFVFWPGEPDVPASMHPGVPLEATLDRVLPWRLDPVMEVAAAPRGLRAPAVFDVRAQEADDGRRVSFRVASQRGAPVVALAIAPTTRLRRLVVEGVSIPPESLRRNSSEPFTVHVLTAPREGVEVLLDVAARGEVEAEVSDVSHGLPLEASLLGRSRPASFVPAHWGDQTRVRRRVRL